MPPWKKKKKKIRLVGLSDVNSSSSSFSSSFAGGKTSWSSPPAYLPGAPCQLYILGRISGSTRKRSYPGTFRGNRRREIKCSSSCRPRSITRREHVRARGLRVPSPPPPPPPTQRTTGDWAPRLRRSGNTDALRAVGSSDRCANTRDWLLSLRCARWIQFPVRPPPPPPCPLSNRPNHFPSGFFCAVVFYSLTIDTPVLYLLAFSLLVSWAIFNNKIFSLIW